MEHESGRKWYGKNFKRKLVHFAVKDEQEPGAAFTL